MVAGKRPAIHDGVVCRSGNQSIDEQRGALPLDGAVHLLRAHLVLGIFAIQAIGPLDRTAGGGGGSAVDHGFLFYGEDRVGIPGQRLHFAVIGVEQPFPGEVAVGIGRVGKTK